MTEGQRKAVYSAAAAVLAALGAWGIVDAATQDQILQVVQGVLTAFMAVIPLLAHRKVGASGVDDPVAVVATDPGMVPPADVVDETDPGMIPPDEDEPRHAEPSVTPDGEGVARVDPGV